MTLSAAAAAPSNAISTYSWELADGNRPNGMTISTSYAAPGVYPVVLKVTDAEGLSTQVVQTITVAKPVSAELRLSRIVKANGTVAAEAVIPNSITDEAGRRLGDPVVFGSWSGAVSGDAMKDGLPRSGIRLVSPATKSPGACFTFTVTRIDAHDPGVTAPAADATPKQRQTYVPTNPLTASTCTQQAAR